MGENTKVYINSSATCKGQLDDAKRPFSSIDEAVKAWYKSLCPPNEPSKSDASLTAVIETEGEYPLQLVNYESIDFIGEVDGIKLKSNISTTAPASTFRDVSFTNLEHNIVAPETEGTSDTATEPVRFEGTVLYDENANIEVTQGDSTPVENTEALALSPVKAMLGGKLELPNKLGLPLTKVILVAPGAVVKISSGVVIDLPGKFVIGFENRGFLSINLDKAIFTVGSVVDGPGSTVIHNSNDNTQATLFVGHPRESFLISGSGRKRILNFKLIISLLNNQRTDLDNDFFEEEVNNERSLKTHQKEDMYIIRSLQGITTLSSSEEIIGPYVEVTNSTFNSCALSSSYNVYLADTKNIKNTYNDLVCTKILGTEDLSNKNGPIFSVYGGSSLVTNGSSFQLATVICGDYIHQRLDGKYFIVNMREEETCSPHICKTRTIYLPEGCEWNGRELVYIRTDCSNTKVYIKTKGTLQGKDCKIQLLTGQTLSLYNFGGDYRIVSSYSYEY